MEEEAGEKQREMIGRDGAEEEIYYLKEEEKSDKKRPTERERERWMDGWMDHHEYE